MLLERLTTLCLGFALLAGGALLPAYGRAQAPSFDCGAAQSEAEELVCSDASLAKLDARLAERFEAAGKVVKRQESGADEALAGLRADQRGWIKGRDECWKADDPRDCVEASYLRRESELVARWLLEEPTAVVTFTCGGNPANETTASFFDTELPSVRIEYGDAVDTGSLTRTASGSRYEASFGRSLWIKGDDATLVWPEGRSQDCTRSR